MIKLKEHHIHKYRDYGIELSTGYSDEYPYKKPTNSLHIKFLYHSWWFAIPQIIKPKTKWVDTSKYEWATPNADGKKGYWDHIRRDYGISTFENTVHIHYGIQPGSWSRDDPKNSDHTKVLWIPWMTKRFIRTSYYEPESQKHLKTYYARKRGDMRNYLDDEYKFIESIPKLLIKFKDFDGEEITAKAHVEEREWRHGTGWFKWLSLFVKPTICRSLYISYDKETGYEKGSWKGGTVGQSIDIRKGEIVESAFMRLARGTDRYRNHGEKSRNFSNVEFSYDKK